MSTEDEIYEALEELRIVEDKSASGSIVNMICDKFDAYNLSIDFLQETVDYLLDSIVLQINPEIRADMFELIERAYQKNYSISIDLETLIEMFDDSDPSLISNTLLLFPIAGNKKEHLEIAKKYLNNQDKFIAKNAEYAVQYLAKK